MNNRSNTTRTQAALLSLAALFLSIALLTSFGWYHSSKEKPTAIEYLSSTQRQQLVERLLERSPGIFTPAYYEPAIGYTLRPEQETHAWGDTFTPNELGYRTGPVAKPDGVFRVVFIGDSWVFGMGVSEAQAFPKQFEKAARELNTGSSKVEAWDLALPGYNTVNEIAALEFFLDRIQPDAVVFSPMPNDMNSSHGISPGGHLIRANTTSGFYEDGLWLQFRRRIFDSYLLRQRWRSAFDAIKRMEMRLQEREIPLLIYFVATWEQPIAHHLMKSSEVESPYIFTPKELTSPKWYNPPPVRHANPAANRLYGRIVYRALAQMMDWPALTLTGEELESPLFKSVPEGDWGTVSDAIFSKGSERVPERYSPATAPRFQCVGVMDCETGAMGRNTMVMIGRLPGVNTLTIKVESLPFAESIYPLVLQVSVPSPAGGSQTIANIAAGDHPQELSLPMPDDIQPGAVLDVVFRASRVTLAPKARVARSVRIIEIKQN